MASDTVEVQVNGERRSVPRGLTLDGLLRHLALNPQLIVVEYNGEILARDSYASVRITQGDVLELVHFVGGGT